MDELYELRRKGATNLLWICWACVAFIGADVWWTGNVMPVVAAALLTAVPTIQIMCKRFDLQTRLSIGLAVPLYPAIMLWQWTGGEWMLDIHMAFFAALAMLTMLADWRPVLLAAVVTAIHHLVTNFVAPSLVFPDGADFARVILHAVIVVIETTVLVVISHGFEKLVVDQAHAHAAKVRIETTAQEERANAAAEQNRVIDQLGSGLRALAVGDLSSRLQHAFPQSYEDLRGDFNSAATDLDRIVRDVTSSAEVIETGSSEISSATDDLARRTEQQASTLEHIADALRQLNVTVNENASSAKELESNVARARHDAMNGRSIVENAASAMGEIEKSANEIGQIITLIDGIAFQTNLLALNAGVEAARAGEAGKGFAVVATEVRALAQRSADAANEIKSLIAKSGEQVSHGVKLVSESGESLLTIVSGIAEIDQAIARIAKVSQEQASEITQINDRVGHLDSATQQNAAMVEEGTAAARQLSNEAERLTKIVSNFIVSGGNKTRSSTSSRGIYSHAA